MLPVDATFSAAWRISCGETNCPFLMFTVLPVRPAAIKQIGLAAEERGNLQDVDGFRGRSGLRRLVDVGQHGVALRSDAGENAQPFFQPWAAVGLDAAAIGLIEGSFEDERTGDSADFAREEVDVLFAFDDAWTGDQRQRPGPIRWVAALLNRRVRTASERFRCAACVRSCGACAPRR